MRGVRSRASAPGAGPPTSRISFGPTSPPPSRASPDFPDGPIFPKRKVCLDVTSRYPRRPDRSTQTGIDTANPRASGDDPSQVFRGRRHPLRISGRKRRWRSGRPARLDSRCCGESGWSRSGVDGSGTASMSVLDRFRLDGRVALVTGGSRGLGRVMAEALASAGAVGRALGARRGAGRRRWPREVGGATGAKALGVGADVDATGRRRGDGRQDARRASAGSTSWSTTPGSTSAGRSSSSARTTGTR